MKCVNCGAELKESSRFCPECGTPVAPKEKTKETPVKEEAKAPAAAEAEKKPTEAPKTEKNGSAEKPDATKEIKIPEIPKISEIHEIKDTAEPDKKAEPSESDKPASIPVPKAPDIQEKQDIPKPADLPADDTDKLVAAIAAEAHANAVAEKRKADNGAIKPLPHLETVSMTEDIGKMSSELAEQSKKPAAPKPVQEPAPAPKPAEPKKADPQPVKQESKPEIKEPEQPEKPKKKGGAGPIIAVIIVLLLIGAGAWFMLNSTNTAPPAQNDAAVTEPVETETSEQINVTEPVETETSTSETNITEPVTEAVTEQTSETSFSESESIIETSTEAVTEASTEESAADAPAAGIAPELTVVPQEHKEAMGTEASTEFSMSSVGIPTAAINSNSVITAEYTSSFDVGANPAPVIMMIINGDSTIDVRPTGTAEGMVMFDGAAVVDAITAAGITADNVDIIRFRSGGAPIDVTKIVFRQN